MNAHTTLPPARNAVKAKMPVDNSRKHWTQQELDKAKAMFDLGASVRQVDAAIGRNVSGSSSRRVYPANRGNPRGKTYRTPPRLWDVFDGCDDAVAAWVLKQVPPGATAVDIVRSIIIDAFYEEHANG